MQLGYFQVYYGKLNYLKHENARKAFLYFSATGTFV